MSIHPHSEYVRAQTDRHKHADTDTNTHAQMHRQTHTLHTIVPLSLQKERVTFGRSYSDEECEDELVPMATKSAASSMQKLAPKVRKKVNDIGYNILLLTVTTESLQETWRII